MGIKYYINGKQMTKKEYAAHNKNNKKDNTSVNTNNSWFNRKAITTTIIPEVEYALKYIDLKRLSQRCTDDIIQFNGYGQAYETPDGLYFFKDNGKKLLAVGHLDTVQKPNTPKRVGNKFFASTLDDRLGVYMLLDMIPKMLGNMPYDLLLTTGEETGKSTARYFRPPRQYNWMVEIDRMAKTTAMYEYETEEYSKMVKGCGMTVARGSNTDIRYLNHLGVFGANFACDYHNNHSMNAYCNLDGVESQAEKIIDFIMKYKDMYLPYVPKKKVTYTSTYNSGYYNGYYGNNDYFYNGRYGRYTENSSEHDTVLCNKCYHLKRHCTCKSNIQSETTPKNKTSDQSKKINKICSICMSKACSGLVKCSDCKLMFHGNTYIELFGMCQNCLSYNGANWIDIYKVVDTDPNVASKAIKEIYNVILDKE